MAATLKNISVLLIDNEQKIAGLIREVLVKLGFAHTLIYPALDGYQGLEILRKKTVDFIICDWEITPQKESMHFAQNSVVCSKWGNFPPVNGASFVRCLRMSERSPAPFLPVIMLTSPTVRNQILFARDAGVNEILVKPLIAEDLAKRIIAITESTRDFITCDTYKGPCRRRANMPLPPGMTDRRGREVKIIRHSGVAQQHG